MVRETLGAFEPSNTTCCLLPSPCSISPITLGATPSGVRHGGGPDRLQPSPDTNRGRRTIHTVHNARWPIHREPDRCSKGRPKDRHRRARSSVRLALDVPVCPACARAGASRCGVDGVGSRFRGTGRRARRELRERTDESAIGRPVGQSVRRPVGLSAARSAGQSVSSSKASTPAWATSMSWFTWPPLAPIVPTISPSRSKG